MRRLALTALFCPLLATSACAEDQASPVAALSCGGVQRGNHDTGQQGKPETNERGNIPKKLKEEAGLIHERGDRSEEHTSELQSREKLVCRLLLEKEET